MARENNIKMPVGPVVDAKAQSGPGGAELPPPARRALAEAEARRSAAGGEKSAPTEIGGPDGLEPTRYGDWEIDGIASDF